MSHIGLGIKFLLLQVGLASCFVIFPYKLSGGGPRENLAHQAGETVWKRNQDGILVWDVDLVKRWGAGGVKQGIKVSQKYLKTL